MTKILSMILAGGEGTRLYPLTQSRTKPSIPFGGSYRLVDFVLNNFINSNLMRIYVITQFKSQSLTDHLRQAWNLGTVLDHFIDSIPAQMSMGKHWYQGTADAIYQNINFIENDEAEHICIFGSDHIFKMDIRQKIAYHEEKGAHLTVSAIKLPISMAHSFGIIEVDKEGRMIGFEEKPTSNPKTLPGDPEHVLASMGNYIFDSKVLQKELREDAAIETSSHDFGNDIIPKMYPKGKVFVYNLNDNKIKNEDGECYWRDVGTIDAYWESHMDLVKEEPPFSLYNRAWPLHTYYPALPAVAFRDFNQQKCKINQSLLSDGCVIHGSKIEKSILGFNCSIQSNTTISESVIIGDAKIGKNCIIKKAIIDKNVIIGDNVQIGVDIEQDRKLYTVSDEGVIVIPKGSAIGFPLYQ